MSFHTARDCITSGGAGPSPEVALVEAGEVFCRTNPVRQFRGVGVSAEGGLEHDRRDVPRATACGAAISRSRPVLGLSGDERIVEHRQGLRGDGGHVAPTGRDFRRRLIEVARNFGGSMIVILM